MNTPEHSNIVNSSQYTPIYLIQNPIPAQGNYFITLANVEPKPVCDNLKSFYENSGNIEGVFANTVSLPKPRILKKPETPAVGNSLKLASFLLPKSDSLNKPYIVNNFVLTSETTTQSESINTIPLPDINRKIAKVKDVPIAPRNRIATIQPKFKPKEILNKLDDSQMKMVNQALKIFTDPDKIVPEPTYDPLTNTKFIYKVVSPKDLTVVGKKNVLPKEKKEEKKPEIKKENVKKQIFIEDDFDQDVETPAVTKVTRSGRTVKLPKIIVPEDTPHKPKKRNHIVTCFQCSTEFSSLYRLQKHYENHPTHIPAKTHSNLFHCLLAIVKGGSVEDRTNIFIQQLEQLIVKLKSLLPCLLNNIDGNGGKPCTINENVGRIFGMDPGKHNIDVDALNCVKDKDGYCVHNPPLIKVKTEVIQPSKLLPTVKNEDTPTALIPNDEDCARISSAEKWPTVHKRVWKLKKLISEKFSPKKMKLEIDDNSLPQQANNLESIETKIRDSDDADMRLTYDCDDILSKLGNSEKDLNYSAIAPDNYKCNTPEKINEDKINDKRKAKGHIQFHSTHFDIRSSPIKPSSTVFRKFQINPDKLPKYDVQMIGATEMDTETNKEFNTISDLHGNFINNSMHSKDNSIVEPEWILANDKSEDGYTKSNNLIEPALIHVKDSDKLHDNENFKHNENTNDNNLLPNQESVLQFLDALSNTSLSYPAMEIREHNDFNLDLFSFSNTQ